MTYVALLRAVNVGGTGRLPMNELKTICAEVGFTGVESYIASGNVVFDSGKEEPEVRNLLEAAVRKHMGKPIQVFVRSSSEIKAVLESCPFPPEEASRIYALFLQEPPTQEAEERMANRTDEQVAMGARELYIYYPTGMGTSKLRIPSEKVGTARNMNTVAKLVVMSSR